MRVIRALVLVALATWGLYLLVAQLFLWTPLLTHLVSSSGSMKLDYEGAWSVWPGRAHVSGLRIRIHEDDVDALIAIEHADASFDLPALLSHRMTVRNLDASGVTVWVRPRYQPDDLGPDTLEGQPEIPGLPDARRESNPPPPISDANYNLFTIDLRQVIADPVREVWIGPYRFAGDAHVEGSLFLRPARALAIGPARADVRNGDLVLAKRPFAQAVHGTVECTMPLTDVKTISDQELLRRFDVLVDVESDIADFGFLRRYLAETNLRIDAGSGHAKGHAHLAHGEFENGAMLELQSKRLAVHHPRVSGVLDLAFEWVVDRGEAHAQATLSQVSVTARGAEAWPLRAETMSLTGRSRSLDLSTKPFGDLELAVKAPAIRVTDLRILRLFEQSVTLAGRATIEASGKLDVPKNVLTGEASLTAKHVVGSYGGVAVSSEIAMSGKLQKLDLVTTKGSVADLKIALDDVKVRAEGGEKPPAPWWARIDAHDLIFDRDHFIAELSGKLRDARPIMYVLAAKQEIPEWTRSFLTMVGLDASAHFETGPGRIEVDRLQAKASPWEVGGHWKQLGERHEGELYLGNGVLGLKVPLDSGGGSAKPAIGGGPKGSE